MSYALPGPCPDGHQELQLMTECTTLTDTERQMLCNRCCHAMSFEDAVRNNERMQLGRVEGIRIAAEELLELARRDGRVADQLEEFFARRNRINGGFSGVLS